MKQFLHDFRIIINAGIVSVFAFFSIQPIISGWWVPVMDFSKFHSNRLLFVLFLLIYYAFLILNIIWYIWELQKKNSDTWWRLLLLAFLPALILPILAVTEVVNRDTLSVWTLPVILVLLAWLALLFLEIYRETAESRQMSIIGQKLFSIIYRPLMISAVIILVAALTFSFFYSRNATTVFRHEVAGRENVIQFSFEYPVSFSRAGLYHAWISSPDLEEEFTWYRQTVWPDTPRTYLNIGFARTMPRATSLIDYITYGPTQYSEDTYLVSPFGNFGMDIDQPFFMTTIDGNPALYTTVTSTKPPEYKSFPGTVSLYLFEADGYFWAIELRDNGKITEHPPEYFTRLLESFTIYDD